MISYQAYKVMHIFFIALFFSSMGFAVESSALMEKKSVKIFWGLVAFVIFVAGMGLIARLGYTHGQPFPLWFKLKIVNWVIMCGLFVPMMRLKEKAYRLFCSFLFVVIGLFNIWIAVNKPL